MSTHILSEQSALEYLRSALPQADRMTLKEDALLRVVRHALALRDGTPWGKSLPEDVFLPYVLFPRVNNEDPVFYHSLLWDALRPRIEGMDMALAVLEVNRWCFEQATYQSTDGRTANALTVVRRGFGRCGEESVLLVCALRACGIPARQIYVPLWSHCDDNHAWVEAWVDGTWRYLGACEPELSLDSGWFTAAASKAMLVHTRAYGVLPAGERCENRIGSAYVINRTAAYAKTALLTLRVVEGDAPRPGIRVDFEVVNMAAYRPICSKRTDANGEATLLTGLGTLHLWLTDGARAMELTADLTDQCAYTVDFSQATPPAPGETRFEQRPPRESKMQPSAHSRDQAEAHRRYMEAVERRRAGRYDGVADPLVRAARGNGPVIAAFLSDQRFDADDKRALLESLREKDLADVTAEVLEDALTTALPWKSMYPREVWIGGVLCPRVANEMLRPERRWLGERLPAGGDPRAIWEALSSRLAPCAFDPPTLLPGLRAIVEHGLASDAARDLLFVAACRANGLAARLDPLAGEKQVWRDGAYRAFEARRDLYARLTLVNGADRALAGDADFSVSTLENGAWRALSLYGATLETSLELPVVPGLYRVMTSSREIDGSCVGIARVVSVAAGETASLSLRLSPTRTAEKLLWAALPPLSVRTGERRTALPESAGSPAIIAAVAPGQEPTEHFLNELLDAREALSKRGIAVWLLLEEAAGADNAKLRRVLAEVAGARCACEPDIAAMAEWRARLNARELRLPLAVAIAPSGEGLFAFVNYNVGSVATLVDIIDAAGNGGSNGQSQMV